MKTVVAVCVYDRFENIQRWVRCWKQCDTKDAELVIIHNHYNNKNLYRQFANYCSDNNIRYIPREKQGFDIGAFQDVCRGRLKAFPDYSHLLWCTDDTFPMTKDFITPFIDTLNKPDVGVAAMHISNQYVRHIRTTGFMLRKETASKLTFKVDPIITKDHCYGFEHRDGPKTFYNQVQAMGLRAVMVTPLETSPLWDSGFIERIERLKEHEQVFGSQLPATPVTSNQQPATDKVVVICPIYDMYPQIISSLICQTHKNWELLLIHNGPQVNGLDSIVKGYNEPRVNFLVHPVATGNYGHPLRQWALKEIKENKLAADASYVLITNCDNYYCPTYFEYLLNGFKANAGAVASYCSDMVHSYLKWITQPCWLERGHIDCGGVLIRKDVAADVGWRSFEHSSDWIYFNDIIKKHGASKWVKVRGTLFMHN